MNKEKKLCTKVYVIAALCIVAVILLVIGITGKEQKKGTVDVGVILTGEKSEEGWNGVHYAAIEKAGETLGMDIFVKENVKENTGQCNVAIEELVKEGAEMIILTSYNYSAEAKELVKQYPDIVFYVNSSEHHDINMTSYFVRMYQPRYLSGIIAGMKTENNKIGYVAAMANNEVNRGINAFTLGVKRVNPDAEVVVTFTGEWDNRELEMNAATKLIEQEQVDVLTYHQNKSNVAEVADNAGIYSIGYHETLPNGSSKNLATVACNWELVYEAILRGFLVGKSNIQENYWIGLEEEAVELLTYSDEVSEEIITEIEMAKEEILSGKDVFSGTIYDKDGNVRCGEKEFISDDNLLENMNWYVKGVRIYE